MPNETETSAPIRSISETAANISPVRSARNEWMVTIPAGTPPEALLRPDYWKHVTHRFRVGANDGKGGDIIAICADRTWRANYEIRDIGPLHMTLVILRTDSDGVCRYGGEGDLPLETKTHYVEFINIGHMHAVRRKSYKEITKNRFQSEQLAATYMHETYPDIAA